MDAMPGKRFDYSHNSIKYYEHNFIDAIDRIKWSNPVKKGGSRATRAKDKADH